jgi:GLPGLI family protein
MKHKIIFIAITLFYFSGLHAQQFISKAKIEYEVTANVKKTMGRFGDMIDNMSTFKTGFYTFTFANNKSIYKFDRWDPASKIPNWFKESDEQNIWYFDYNTRNYNIQKNIDGSNLILEGAIKKLHWKITNENRIIAGFNCRKAVAQVFDSVYVFAFYTDEITIAGGPCSINGLPGLILGMTIPRLYTSWIATKVMVNDVDVSIIKPVQTKKPYTLDALGALIAERMKDWYSDDAQDNKEIQEQKARNIWISLL